MNTHQVHIRVDATRRTPLRRIWRYVGYDEPNYTYTPNGHSLLDKLGRMNDGPYYVRAHNLLCSGDGTGRPKWGSTNVYSERPDGAPVYDWALLDRILDTYQDTHCVPFVELGFMPQALTTAPPGTPYDTLLDGGWRYPPKDYVRWQDLVGVLATHCLARYGLRAVSRWYWELWNEPDIFYWAGTLEEYCRLYDHTVAGLLAVLPQARVGGPATTDPSRPAAATFLRGFLEHCLHGDNAVTGQTGARLDFVSFHTKGGGYRREVAAAKQTPTIHRLVHNVAAGLAIMGQFPGLAGREVILSEADPDGMAAFGQRDNANLRFRNTAYYASYVATAVCKLLDVHTPDARVDGMLTWAFQFEGRAYFEGLRTLATNDMDKPVLNVFRALAKLGGARLHLICDGTRDVLAAEHPDAPDAPPDVNGLAALNGTDEVQVLLVSHHDDWDVATPTQGMLEVIGLEPGRAYCVQRYGIDAIHSNAHTAWVQMGQPQPPTAEQLTTLQRAAQLALVQEAMATVDDAGRLVLTLPLPEHSVSLLHLRPL